MEYHSWLANEIHVLEIILRLNGRQQEPSWKK